MSPKERVISSGNAIVTEIDDRGDDTTAARRALALFEDMQRLHIADRNRIMDELSAGERSPSCKRLAAR